jgi:hypothetical protein
VHGGFHEAGGAEMLAQPAGLACAAINANRQRRSVAPRESSRLIRRSGRRTRDACVRMPAVIFGHVCIFAIHVMSDVCDREATSARAGEFTHSPQPLWIACSKIPMKIPPSRPHAGHRAPRCARAVEATHSHTPRAGGRDSGGRDSEPHTTLLLSLFACNLKLAF